MSTSNFVRNVRGVPVLKVSWMPEKNINDAIDYVPRDGDVIICSYPKTGTYWLSYIIQQILSKGEKLPDFTDFKMKIIPAMGMAGIDAIEALQEPRIYRHHFPQSVIAIRDNAKYVYLYRNPEDVFISYFHYFAEVVGEPLTMDDFMNDFLDGNVWFGNYCDHVLSYLPHGDRDNVLFVTYENLVSNRKEEILRVAKFLGEEYFEDLKRDVSILMDRIVENTEFEYMKKNVRAEVPEWSNETVEPDEVKYKEINFFRNGTVGDGKNSLTESQLVRLREHVAMKMRGSRLAEEWFIK